MAKSTKPKSATTFKETAFGILSRSKWEDQNLDRLKRIVDQQAQESVIWFQRIRQESQGIDFTNYRLPE